MLLVAAGGWKTQAGIQTRSVESRVGWIPNLTLCVPSPQGPGGRDHVSAGAAPGHCSEFPAPPTVWTGVGLPTPRPGPLGLRARVWQGASHKVKMKRPPLSSECVSYTTSSRRPSVRGWGDAGWGQARGRGAGAGESSGPSGCHSQKSRVPVGRASVVWWGLRGPQPRPHGSVCPCRQEKRKRQAEVETKRRQLEDDRRQLQHLKVRSGRPRGPSQSRPGMGGAGGRQCPRGGP